MIEKGLVDDLVESAIQAHAQAEPTSTELAISATLGH
jgi:hypothetical protein